MLGRFEVSIGCGAGGLIMSGVLRAATIDDLDAIFEIEVRAYESPWTRGLFSDCLRVGNVVIIFEQEETVRGYGVLSIAAGEGHILNLCVDPFFHGKGIGAQLLSGLINTARVEQVSALFLEVRESNQNARSLYHKWGFNEIGLRKNYYPSKQGREDAIVLARQFVDLM